MWIKVFNKLYQSLRGDKVEWGEISMQRIIKGGGGNLLGGYLLLGVGDCMI